MKQLTVALMFIISFTANSQTIFTYGKESVTVQEFLKAYRKNNVGVKSEKAFRDYLDLYIASRLKIAEAKRRGYDTLPQLVSDLENLRQQIMPSYVNDKESINKLVNEALTRSQKDLHIAHIFISNADSVAGRKRLDIVLDKLKTSNFSEVAKEFSEDPSAKTNGGDIGWITAFTLPYELENLAYSTPAGKTSTVYTSKAGYHIFKNIGERNAVGRMKAAEILLAFPPDANDQLKQHSKQLADSLYNRLIKADDFGKLASEFSNDVVSAANNGQMMDFGIGQYEPEFENVAFSLAKDGDFSKPFLTSHGYHIIKRLSKISPPDKNDEKAMQLLRERVEQSDRMNSTKTALVQKILKQASYKKMPFNTTELWSYSDSVLNFKMPAAPLHVGNKSVLFTIGNKEVTATDWTNYAQTFRYKPDGSGIKPYPLLWNEFVDATATDYYQKHLEEYNPDFRQQINEFSDGNLFFEIMQRQVWGPAQTDSTALVSYFEKHKAKYYWNKSADAIIFYANDAASAKSFYDELKKSPGNWRTLITDMSEKIAADSSRFEWSQIPNPSKIMLRPGMITTPIINKTDNTASFAYVIKLYTKPEARNFNEAKGLVINDYQNEIEKQWLAKLKKDYPVTINQKVVDDIIRNKKW